MQGLLSRRIPRGQVSPAPAGQLEPRGWLRCRWAFRWVGWVFAGLLGVGLGVLAAGSSARLSVHSQAAPGLRSQIHEVTEEVKERLPPDGLLPGVQFPWTARARWRLRLFPLLSSSQNPRAACSILQWRSGRAFSFIARSQIQV